METLEAKLGEHTIETGHFLVRCCLPPPSHILDARSLRA